MSKSVGFFVCFAVGIYLFQPFAAAAQKSQVSDDMMVVSVENAFLQSRVTGDISKIRASFAFDGTFIYENGDERTRPELEADVASGSYWLTFDRSEGTIEIFGDAAVTHAVLSIKLGGGQIDRARTTGVYAKRAGNWRIVSWQSTPLIGIDPPHSKP